MKKILMILLLTVSVAISATAQKAPGNSAFGHSHKMQGKQHEVKKQHFRKAVNPQKAEVKAINDRHKAAIAAIKANTTLSKAQKEEQIKAANMQHKTEMQALKPKKH